MTTGVPASAGTPIEEACTAIFTHLCGAINGMSALSRSVPFHVLLLDPYPVAAHQSDSIEEALTEIELQLHEIVIGRLKVAFPGNWWPESRSVFVPLVLLDGRRTEAITPFHQTLT